MPLSLASETQLVGSLCKRHAVTPFGAPTACKRTVSGSIALLCSRFFSPFPHGTGSLSVSQEYLALADGAAGFRQDFSGPALLRIPLARTRFRIRGFHALWPAFPGRSAIYSGCRCAVLRPRCRRDGNGLGCSAFAHHYSRNHWCFLFLQVLRCFSSLRWLQFW